MDAKIEAQDLIARLESLGYDCSLLVNTNDVKQICSTRLSDLQAKFILEKTDFSIHRQDIHDLIHETFEREMGQFNISDVSEIYGDTIFFRNGCRLNFYNRLNIPLLEGLYLDEFDSLMFDLDYPSIFIPVPGCGLEIKPINGFSVKIPLETAKPIDALKLMFYAANNELLFTKDITDCLRK